MLFHAIACLLLLSHSTVSAQEEGLNTMVSFLDTPLPVWTVPTGSRVETEVVLSPAKDMLLVGGADCSMTAIGLNGVEEWKYVSTSSTTIDCKGGILFGTTDDQVDYAARAIPNEGGFDSQIVAVNLADGNSIAYSIGPIPGIVAGTPRITADQKYLIVTSNTENLSRGHFTVWNVATGMSIFQFSAPDNSTEPVPFGPIGFQHSPIQGYYDGGFENQNDIFVWGVDNELSDPAAGAGQLYAFQFPVVDTDPLEVTLVGDSRGFQTPTEPVFDNDGLSMYWTVTRNELRCWVGEVNMGRNSFDKRPATIETIPKDAPRANTGMAPPVVTRTSVYGPMAGSQIFKIDLSCSTEELVVVNTAASVNNKILPTLDERFVFYSTVEPDSKLYMLNADTMEQVWEYQLARGVEADMALSPDGTTVYVVSAAGVLEAVQIGELVALPTESPTLMPTTSPTISSQPTISPAPTNAVTESPTLAPATGSPTAEKGVSDNVAPTPSSSSAIQQILPVVSVVAFLFQVLL